MPTTRHAFRGNPNTKKPVHLPADQTTIGKPREEIETEKERERRIQREAAAAGSFA